MHPGIFIIPILIASLYFYKERFSFMDPNLQLVLFSFIVPIVYAYNFYKKKPATQTLLVAIGLSLIAFYSKFTGNPLFFEHIHLLIISYIIYSIDFCLYIDQINKSNLILENYTKNIPKETRVFVDHDIEAEVPSIEVSQGQMIVLQENKALAHDSIIANGSGFADMSIYGVKNLDSVATPQTLLAGTVIQKGKLLVNVCNTIEKSAIAQFKNILNFNPKVSYIFYILFFVCILSFLCISLMGNFSLHSTTIAILSNLWLPTSYLYLTFLRKNLTTYTLQGAAIFNLPKRIDSKKTIYMINSYECSMEFKKTRLSIYPNEFYQVQEIFSYFMPLARKIDRNFSIFFLKEGLSKKITFEILEDFFEYNYEYTGTVLGEKVSWNLRPTIDQTLLNLHSPKNKNSYYLYHELKIADATVCHLCFEIPLCEGFPTLFKEWKSQIILTHRDGSLFCQTIKENPNIHLASVHNIDEYQNLITKFQSEDYELIELHSWNGHALKKMPHLQYGVAPFYGKDGSFFYVNSLTDQLLALEYIKNDSRSLNHFLLLVVLSQIFSTYIAIYMDYPTHTGVVSFCLLFFLHLYLYLNHPNNKFTSHHKK